MATPVDIANIALGHIGEPPILNFNEDTVASRTVNVFYDQAVKETLRDHPWNFAISRAVLARLATAPAFEWDHQYQLPADFLRLISINTHPTPYVIEGRKILTNAETAQLRYITLITDTSLFDPMFVAALAARLAHYIALPITQSESQKNSMWSLYLQTLAGARDVDAQEDPPRNTNYSRGLIESRFEGGNEDLFPFRGIS